MRIQHNIAALNSYRNLTNNNSAVAKNLEKLSSGYRINRAGDDAAGLAISEKMRAQITGLQTAQKNASDGVSLVQTAEGAMTEVHSMLNRMVELATQSANGTYDETDRIQLQKEVDQLKSEIDRIADSSNFNGIKLLDGSMDADGRRATTTTTFSGLTMADNTLGVSADGTYGKTNGKGGIMLTGQYSADTTGAVDASDNSIRYHQEAKGAGRTSFTVDLDGINYEVKAGTELKDLVFAMQNSTVGTTDATGEGIFLNAGMSDKLEYSVTAGNEGVTSEDIATAIQKVIDENDGKVYLKVGGKAIEYQVTRDGDKLNFEMTDKGYADAVKETDADATKNFFAGNFNFGVAYKGTASTDDDVKAFATAISDKKLGNTSTCEINQGSKSAGTIYAQAYIRFDAAADTTKGINKISDIIADGKGLQIGDEYYLFAGSDATFNTEYADNVKVVDIRDLNNLTKTDGSEDADLQKALTRLSMAAKDNEMFDVQVEGRGTILAINERTTYTGNANLTEKDWGLEKQIQKFDSATSKTTVTKEAGEALTLQIGDTAEDFNRLKVNIQDIHTTALGIGDINISTQDGAAAAVDKIKAAINQVSDIRGTLGATQNRLDHTINNLSVQTENITAAESRIRDVDMAEEMMAYTKNNILVQAAQAMLAQANQVPQGVLQLLQ